MHWKITFFLAFLIGAIPASHLKINASEPNDHPLSSVQANLSTPQKTLPVLKEDREKNEVYHYEVKLTPNMALRQVQGQTIIKISEFPRNGNEIVFAKNQLNIKTVLVNVNPVSFQNGNKGLVVNLEPANQAKFPIVIQISYIGLSQSLHFKDQYHTFPAKFTIT